MRPRTKGGYILFEAIVAMALLSMGIVAIHGSMRQTVKVRGRARDFTQARFLLEQVLSEAELQPILVEGTASGTFPDELSRFQWKRTVSKVELPVPQLPFDAETPDVPLDILGMPIASLAPEEVELDVEYIGKLEVVISWTRLGDSFEAKLESLFNPDRLYIPEEHAEDQDI